MVIDGDADGHIRQTGGNAAVECSVAVEQVVTDLAAQGDAIGVEPADFHAEEPVERDSVNQAAYANGTVFLVLHERTALSPVDSNHPVYRSGRRAFSGADDG